MFSKGSDITIFNGMKVQLTTGQVISLSYYFSSDVIFFQIGQIDGTFGKSGMFVVRLKTPLDLGGRKPKEVKIDAEIHLKFKKFIYHTNKKAMLQTDLSSSI